MTFDRPMFFLLLLALPVVWMWAKRKQRSARVSCVLKSMVYAALVIALADPRVELPVRKVAITMLVDTSASMPRESIQQSENMLREIVKRGFTADIHLITFAGRPQLQDVSSNAARIAISENVDPTDGMSTDLEGAIGLALSTFPPEGARRILLVTDGNQNRGDALAAASRAREAGVVIFTEPSGGMSRLPILLTSISAPDGIFSGERFTVSLGLDSPASLPVHLSIRSESHEIAAKSLELRPGGNVVDMDARITESGVKPLEIEAEANGVQQVLFSQAVTVRRPRVLYITADLEPSAPLLKTLKEAEIDVETASAFPADNAKTTWDAVLLDNYPDQPLLPPEETAIQEYVSRGGGLIFIGGDKNAKLAREPKSVLEKMLPVRGDPNPPEQPTALMLVLDKSMSMDGDKIEMVQQAAKASVASLRPIDKVGLIAFDKEFRWVIPLRQVADASGLDDLIDSIEASGGTRIYPAVQAAYDAIHDEPASRKHIILLTDGVSPVDQLPQLEADAAANHVTISTIGVGYDVDRKLLGEIADTTHGRFYFIEDPQKITRIVDDETKDLNNTEIVERPVRAVSVRPVELTDGIDFSTAPKLLGFMKTKARDGAETILRTDTGEPLLVRWEYGLGRVTAFLSDSRARWSAPWVSWASYGTLWPQMVRDISRRDALAHSGVRIGTGTADSVVYYDVSENRDKAAETLGAAGQLYVNAIAPDGSSRRMALRQTAPHHYEVSIPADQEGLYRVVPENSSLPLPAAGFFHQPEELKVQAVNVPLLAEVSRVTGGVVNPTVDQLLDQTGSDVREMTPLWPYWLGLALALNFFELAWRKGHFNGLVRWIRRAGPFTSSRGAIPASQG